eukprot:12419613-Karenia_brevis.AAC.1
MSAPVHSGCARCKQAHTPSIAQISGQTMYHCCVFVASRSGHSIHPYDDKLIVTNNFTGQLIQCMSGF